MRSRTLVLFAWLVFVPLSMLISADLALCLTSQDVPAADLPSATAPPSAESPTPGAAPSPADLEMDPGESSPSPEASPEAASQDIQSMGNSVTDNNDSTKLQNDEAAATQGSQPATENNSPSPALDASALTIGPQLGDLSLDPEINKAVAPTLAASLRLSESARKQLADGRVDDALRDLGRAVSLDPSNAFAYYYLGRGYLARKNYTQALTFFRRAVIGFNGRPDWTAEALTYEGLCDEELGRSTDAAQAYKRALAASPNNLRARVGYGRLSSLAGPVGNLDASPPNQDLAVSPPNAPDESAPPEQPPPPPPN
jgi:tetratricopeptide (TPR) repeat protein